MQCLKNMLTLLIAVPGRGMEVLYSASLCWDPVIWKCIMVFMWVKGFNRMETGLCWRNSLLCPDKPDSGLAFLPLLEGVWRDHGERYFCSHLRVKCYTKLVRNTAPAGLCQMVLFSHLLLTWPWSCGWALLGCVFFFPHTFLQWYLNTSGFRSSAVWTFTPPPTNSTPAHSCNSSCAILGGYYTSYLFSFTAAAELCWLAFLGYVLHHQ